MREREDMTRKITVYVEQSSSVRARVNEAFSMKVLRIQTFEKSSEEESHEMTVIED